MSNISITLDLNIVNILIIIIIAGFIISNTCISCINKEGMANILYKTSDGVHNDKYQKVYQPGENYEEVKMMAMVKRNDKGIIIDELHKTIPILTKYEKTRIIGQRAKQINAGAIPFIKPTKDMMTGYLIAKKEVEEKKTPFIIRRPLPNGGSEYWHLKDLEILY